MGLKILMQSMGINPEEIETAIAQFKTMIPVAASAILEMNERSKRIEAKLDALLSGGVNGQ